jgi:hypothetical protein
MMGRLALALLVAWLTLGRIAVAAIPESEPNGRGNPNPIPPLLGSFADAFGNGVAVVAGNLTEGDVDFYALNLTAGQLLLVGLFDDSGGEHNDTRVGVFFEPLSQNDPTVAPVALNDDGGPGFLSRLAVPITQTGVWKVGVTGFRDTLFQGAHLEGRDGPVHYQLILSVATNPAARTESQNNNTLAQADSLPSGGAVLQAHLQPGDVDFFALNVADADQLTVSLFDLQAGTFDSARGEVNDTRVQLFDANGLPVNGGDNDDGGPGFLSNLAVTVPKGAGGRWSIGVTGFRDFGFTGNHLSGPFDYELIVSTSSAVQRCDVNQDGFVDESDVDAILSARGQPATGPDDPRDADGDAQITVLDARACTLQCGSPNCAAKATAACGSLGIEACAVILLLGAVRRKEPRQ